jgi:hypothetical protein
MDKISVWNNIQCLKITDHYVLFLQKLLIKIPILVTISIRHFVWRNFLQNSNYTKHTEFDKWLYGNPHCLDFELWKNFLPYVWVNTACCTYIQPTTSRTPTSHLRKSAALHNSLCDIARKEAYCTDCTPLKFFSNIRNYNISRQLEYQQGNVGCSANLPMWATQHFTHMKKMNFKGRNLCKEFLWHIAVYW